MKVTGAGTLGTQLEPYLGMGEKMLRPARNFLMVPLVLNQLCRFSCWVFRKSLLRCFHCWDVNMPRILPERWHGCPSRVPAPKGALAKLGAPCLPAPHHQNPVTIPSWGCRAGKQTWHDGDRGTRMVLRQNTPKPPPHHPGSLQCFSSYFFSCRPSPKPSLLDGWKTSMDGSAKSEPLVTQRPSHGHVGTPQPPIPTHRGHRGTGRGRSAGAGRWAPSEAPSTLSPPPPAEGQPWGPQLDPGHPGDTPPASHHGDTPRATGTHIEEADVHVEVDVHVVDGPILPATTRGEGMG